MSVVNLSVTDIDFFDKGGDLSPQLVLTISFTTFDPLLAPGHRAVSPSPSSINVGNGCGSISSCGEYTFAFSSSQYAWLNITTQDNQHKVDLGCLCGVNDNGGSDTDPIELWGTQLGPQTLPNGAECAVTSTQCDPVTTSGNSGSREASVTFNLVVETSLQSEARGELRMLYPYSQYVQGLAGGGNYWNQIVCPSGSTANAALTDEELTDALIAVFTIMTLGVGSAAELAVDDVIQTYIDAVIDGGHLGIESLLEGTADEVVSYYPTGVAGIGGLAESMGINCGDLYNLANVLTSEGVFTNIVSGLATYLVNAQQAEVSALEAGSVSTAISDMSSVEQQDSNVMTDVGSSTSGVLGALDPLIAGTEGCPDAPSNCVPSAEFLANDVFTPLQSLLSEENGLLSNEVSTLQSLTGSFSIGGCGPQYVPEGAPISATSGAVPIYVQGGIGPLTFGWSGLPAWASVQLASPTSGLVVGQVPGSSGTSSITLSAQDEVGQTTSCTMTLTQVPPILFSETGLLPGTSWSVTLGGSTESSTSSTIAFGEGSGYNAGYTVPSVGGITPTPSSGSISYGGSTTSVVVSFLSVQLLNHVAQVDGASGSWSQALQFTVTTGISHVLFAWSIGASGGTFQAPSLPAGLSAQTAGEVVASTMSAGFALGSLAPGAYSASMAYSGGTVNSYAMAVYGVSNDYGFEYAFNGAFKVTSLTMASGGQVYLGTEGTGGAWGLTTYSFPTATVDATAGATTGGGPAEVIGRQSSNALSMTPNSNAANYGIAGAAILPVFQQLATYSLSPPIPGVTGWSEGLNFFVASGYTEVLYVWALGGSGASYQLPTLPGSMTVQSSSLVSNSALTIGMASGTMAIGPSSISLAYAGTVNAVSLAIYGISPSLGALQYTESSQATSMSNLASGALVYLGAVGSGGAWGFSATSLTSVDVEAQGSYGGGPAEIIGWQQASAMSLTPNGATSFGMSEAGIY